LLFEVAMLTYAKQMPVAALARMAREHDTRVWRVIEHHVNTARAGMDFSDVVDLGMDETSARRGQDYVSIFMDLTAKRVLFATEGRDANTVRAFAADLKAHGGEPTAQIQRVCCDMSPAFIKGIGEHLSRQPRQADGLEPAVEGHQPQIVFDRYHVVAKANEAVDRVRRVEAKTRPELKRSRYALLSDALAEDL
jgi:transposase